jgi:hypothetical protein
MLKVIQSQKEIYLILIRLKKEPQHSALVTRANIGKYFVRLLEELRTIRISSEIY